MIAPCGLGHVHANLSARQAKELGLLTSGTYGRRGSGSSSSAALQQYLASRLPALTRWSGSTLFNLTWKERVTPSGLRICALRASVPRTSGSGFGSWPTPRANDGTGAKQPPNRTGGDSLKQTAQLAGWPTCTARDHFPAHTEEYIAAKKAMGHGMANLNDLAMLAGWPTPSANEFGHSDRAALEARRERCKETAHNGNGFGLTLAQAITMWEPGPARLTAYGEMLTGSHAAMESGGQLNPEHSRWLMAYPIEWGRCAATVTLSTRKTAQHSFGR